MRSDYKLPSKRPGAAGLLLISLAFTLAPQAVLAESVRIAGQQVFQVNTGTSSMTPNKRAEAIQTNLDNAIVASKDKASPVVNVIYVNGLPVITLAGYQVCTVDGADAKDASTTPALLAQKWSSAMRKSLEDKSSLNSYIAQLSGNSGAGSSDNSSSSSNSSSSASNNYGSGVGSTSGDSYATSPNTPTSAPPLQQQAYVPPPPQNGGAPYNAYPLQQPGRATYGYTSYGAPPNYGQPPSNYPLYGQAPYGNPLSGSVATAPTGTVINAMLKISISTDVAQNGDLVEASILDAMPVQNGSIPAGSTLLGQITEARAGGRLSQSGHLGMKFTSLRTPDGTTSPISAHLVGLVGKYKLNGTGDSTYLHGEGGKAKLGQTLIRGGAGAGVGAALGTAVGAIAGGGYGAGTGAWSGAAIGGGLGVADMALRKGREVKIESGSKLQIQLDQPATIAGGGGNPPYITGGNI